MSEKVFRGQWRGFLKQQPSEGSLDECRSLLSQAKENGSILTGEAYHWQNNVFVYLEGIGEPADPAILLAPLESALAPWPGKETPRVWIPMMDIFHFNEPMDLDHWKRKTKPEARVGKVGLLHPEMVASYIYYHYGLQEERTFGGDKYEIIALHENMLFGYFELPSVVENPPQEPRLKTKSMPENWSDAKIPSHFIRWTERNSSLLPIPSLL